MKKRAIFLDRDGTINIDAEYLNDIKRFHWLPDAIEAIRYINEHGALAIVITNQRGVARGFFPESDVIKLHDWMNCELNRYGAHIDGFYYCPHHPEAKVKDYRKDCDCRKPKPGLILKAAADHDIDLAHSVMIGDMERDVECGKRAGTLGVRYVGGSLLNEVRKFV